MYTIPAYVLAANIDDPRISYKWDDTLASDEIAPAPDEWLTRIDPISAGCKIALGIGMFEWILWRFQRLTRDPLPLQVAEAAWYASFAPARVECPELDREDWIGPVRGPLWCAVTWLLPMVFEGRREPDELDSGTRYLLRLCLHVLPTTSAFLSWLNFAVDRLQSISPKGTADPFEELFAEHDGAEVNDAVGRQVLDPAVALGAVDGRFQPLEIIGNTNPENPFILAPPTFGGLHSRGPFRSEE